jgi:hypothetical protein
MRHHLPLSRHRGATLVEFVVVFPLAVLMVLGLIQTGFAYMAKLQLNHATFMAARVGALNNADTGKIREAVVRGLNPFYQDSSTGNDFVRLFNANLMAHLKAGTIDALDVTVLNPSPEAFSDFGIDDPVKNVTYIPNDNLEWRAGAGPGSSSDLELRDANLLKLKVVYGYELKVPLIAGVLRRMMCGGSIGVTAWGNVDLSDAIAGPLSTDCIRYYMLGRLPIESFAIVEMQSRAERPN